MLKTFVMTGDWMELPIDIGIDKAKILDRINEKDNWVTNSYGALYNSLAITADMDNSEPILISDYPEDKQVNADGVADFIELQPSGELLLPWNREVNALNRPFVMGQEGDVIKVVAR